MTRGAAALSSFGRSCLASIWFWKPEQTRSKLIVFLHGSPFQIFATLRHKDPSQERCDPDRTRRLSGPQFQQGLSCRSGHDVAATNVDAGGREGAVRLFGGSGGRDGGT